MSNLRKIALLPVVLALAGTPILPANDGASVMKFGVLGDDLERAAVKAYKRSMRLLNHSQIDEQPRYCAPGAVLVNGEVENSKRLPMRTSPLSTIRLTEAACD